MEGIVVDGLAVPWQPFLPIGQDLDPPNTPVALQVPCFQSSNKAKDGEIIDYPHALLIQTQ